MKLTYSLLIAAFSLLCACGPTQVLDSRVTFQDVKTISAIEADSVITISQEHHAFVNEVTGDSVNLMQSIAQTGFHFYNELAFQTPARGVLVGGAGLKVRITEDAGATWQQHRFSRFANAFHSIAFSGDTFFAVGESSYIFKSADYGKTWSVMDTEALFTPSPMMQSRYYKARFFDKSIGYIAGEQNGRFALLKTLNAGEDWSLVDTQGFTDSLFAITDFALLSAQEMILVTSMGKCYKSHDQGSNWNLLYSMDAKYPQLSAIAFKDTRTGLIGGRDGKLLHTADGGATWAEIALPKASDDSSVSDIQWTGTQFLVTTSKVFFDDERPVFVYAVDESAMALSPFMSKSDSTVFFMGDSHALDYIDGQLLILDRNNLYKTPAD